MRQKILFLSGTFPARLDSGGKIREFHILERLSRHHEVWVAALKEHVDDDDDVLKAAMPFLDPERCSLVGRVRRLGMRAIADLRDLPDWCMSYTAEELQVVVDGLLAAHRFDAIHVSHSYLAPYVHGVRGVRRVVDHHNVKTRFYADALKQEQDVVRRVRYAAEGKRWFGYERSVLRDFEAHLACTPAEQQALRAIVNGPVALVPSGVDTRAFAERAEPATGRNLLFVGSLDYFPNEEAVTLLSTEILPIVRRAIPDVVFQVVGRKPTPELRTHLLGRPDVWTAFDVRDVRPLLYQSTVFVVPLRNGAGSRLKIMEAMATGLPVVSTRKGSEGLGLEHGEGIALADAPQAFADAVIRLLQDDAHRFDQQTRAAAIARDRFSWEDVLAPLDEVYAA